MVHPTEVPGGAAGAAVGSWSGARRPRGLLSRPIPGELCSPLPENPNAKARSIVEKVCCSVLNRAHLDQNVLEICDAYPVKLHTVFGHDSLYTDTIKDRQQEAERDSRRLTFLSRYSVRSIILCFQ